jgi:hypothetical protein
MNESLSLLSWAATVLLKWILSAILLQIRGLLYACDSTVCFANLDQDSEMIFSVNFDYFYKECCF